MGREDHRSSWHADAETSEAIDGAWAHNRWPTIGLYTGAGIGLLMGIAFVSGLLLTIAFIVALAVIGCVAGLALAAVVYRGAVKAAEPLLRGELQEAAEDHGGDPAQENASGRQDSPGGVAGSEGEPHDHREQA